MGALLVPTRHAHAVLRALPPHWRKKGAPVPKLDGGSTLVVALSPVGARAFDELGSSELEGDAQLIAGLIASGDVRWASGMRLGGSLAPRSAPSSSARFHFVELFAGLGGFRLGLEALGGSCVFASEIDREAAAAYARNFGSEDLVGDITEVETAHIPPHDLLTAGFPCQSFSRAGERGGLSDARGELFSEIIRCARARAPRVLLLENVPNLLRVDDGHAMHTIAEALTSAGYHVRLQLLNAAALVPQHRERLFIVAFRSDLADAARRFQWPTFSSSDRRAASLREVMQADLSGRALDNYRLSKGQWELVRSSHDYRKNPEWRLAQLDGNARTLRGSYRKSFSRFSEFVPLAENGRLREGGGAVTAAPMADVSMGDGEEAGEEEEDEGEVVEGGSPLPCSIQAPPSPRFFTERECARLQGFPESYTLHGGRQYVQLGNAVNPLLVTAVAKCILDALEEPQQVEREATKAAGCGSGARRCEDFLCAASINLLRRVTPPDTGGSHSADGRYGDEEPAERRRRVLDRPVDELYCCLCAKTYSLEAKVECTPVGDGAAIRKPSPTPQLDAAALLASGSAQSVQLVLGRTAPSIPQDASVLTLRIPYTMAGGIETLPDNIDLIERDGAALRRAACSRAASTRAANNDDETSTATALADDDEEEGGESDGDSELTLMLASPSIASSIGGKVWDASLIASAWLAENAHRLPPLPAASSPPPRVLELGSGIGVAGLACAQLYPHMHVTMSDYDPAVISALEENIERNSNGDAAAATLLDFRHFTAQAVADAEAAHTGGWPLPRATDGSPSPLQPYADAGLLFSFDLVLASDVIYETSAALVPLLCRALLKQSQDPNWRPCAMLVLPHIRPRLREFVENCGPAGLACHIERLRPGRRLRRRFDAAHEGWGADNAFSLYTLLPQ